MVAIEKKKTITGLGWGKGWSDWYGLNNNNNNLTFILRLKQ